MKYAGAVAILVAFVVTLALNVQLTVENRNLRKALEDANAALQRASEQIGADIKALDVANASMAASTQAMHEAAGMIDRCVGGFRADTELRRVGPLSYSGPNGFGVNGDPKINDAGTGAR